MSIYSYWYWYLTDLNNTLVCNDVTYPTALRTIFAVLPIALNADDVISTWYETIGPDWFLTNFTYEAIGVPLSTLVFIFLHTCIMASRFLSKALVIFTWRILLHSTEFTGIECDVIYSHTTITSKRVRSTWFQCPMKLSQPLTSDLNKFY